MCFCNCSHPTCEQPHTGSADPVIKTQVQTGPNTACSHTNLYTPSCCRYEPPRGQRPKRVKWGRENKRGHLRPRRYTPSWGNAEVVRTPHSGQSERTANLWTLPRTIGVRLPELLLLVRHRQRVDATNRRQRCHQRRPFSVREHHCAPPDRRTGITGAAVAFDQKRRQ